MKILDIGGRVNTYNGTTHVIDIVPKPEGWDDNIEYIQANICDGLPYGDKEFGFVNCDNVLEDIKDPVLVCKEMLRVASRGRVVVPSVITECKVGIDPYYNSNMYAGYMHHRWLCFIKQNGIIFIQKTPITHTFDWLKNIPKEEKEKTMVELLWINSFKFKELVLTAWTDFYTVLAREFNYDPLGLNIL